MESFKTNVLENKKRKLTIAIDFDGTIVDDMWPKIGPLKLNCKEVINSLIDVHNCDIIIWTCREYNELKEAMYFLFNNDIKYTCINENTPYIKSLFGKDHDCRKIYADLYIDDKSLHFSALNNKIDWNDIFKNILSFKNKNKDVFI